jgi:hypothetical protein
LKLGPGREADSSRTSSSIRPGRGRRDQRRDPDAGGEPTVTAIQVYQATDMGSMSEGRSLPSTRKLDHWHEPRYPSVARVTVGGRDSDSDSRLVTGMIVPIRVDDDDRS